MNLFELEVIELKSQESVEIQGGDWFSRHLFIWQNLWDLNKVFLDEITGESDRRMMEHHANIKV
jgi:hypothetical protein